MTCTPHNAASRRYAYRFLPATLVYAIFLIISTWIFKHYHPAGALAYGLALLPALPLIATMVAVGLYLAEETDEFQRNILIQSMLWGIGATLTVTTTWGFLEKFTGIPQFDPYLAYPLFWLCVGIATPLLKLRYR
jgi:hypothetical protein